MATIELVIFQDSFREPTTREVVASKPLTARHLAALSRERDEYKKSYPYDAGSYQNMHVKIFARRGDKTTAVEDFELARLDGETWSDVAAGIERVLENA